MQAIRFTAADGFELSGTLHGDTTTARAGLLIAPTMGVPQSYYAPFATWLADQGVVVLCFDYRGMGASRPTAMKHSLRGLDADVRTWAERDAGAALAWFDAQLPSTTPIHWLGHSLGAQILGLVPGRERISRVVTIGAGSGYWRENAPGLRRYIWWLWFVIVPLALPLAGYFPGRRLRKVGDLPRGVMAQWRRWCLSPDYLMSEPDTDWRERYARIRNPILVLSFTDDEFMSERNTESLHGFYAGAPKTMRRISPGDIGEKRIGHFGFFRARFSSSLWPQVPQWIGA